MKKSNRIIPIIGAFLLFLAFVAFVSGATGVAFVFLYFAIVLLCFPIVKKILSKKKQTQSMQNVPDMNLFPPQLNNGQRLYKYYSNIEICVIIESEPNYSVLRIGDRLELKQEPSNAYDPHAVAIYDGLQRIGYVYRGIGQDMSNDFLNHGNIIVAYLSQIDVKEKHLAMNIAYYRKPYRNQKK